MTTTPNRLIDRVTFKSHVTDVDGTPASTHALATAVMSSGRHWPRPHQGTVITERHLPIANYVNVALLERLADGAEGKRLELARPVVAQAFEALDAFEVDEVFRVVRRAAAHVMPSAGVRPFSLDDAALVVVLAAIMHFDKFPVSDPAGVSAA